MIGFLKAAVYKFNKQILSFHARDTMSQLFDNEVKVAKTKGAIELCVFVGSAYTHMSLSHLIQSFRDIA